MYKVGEKINLKKFDIYYSVYALETKRKEEFGRMGIPLEVVDENEVDKWNINDLYVNKKKALMKVDFSRISSFKDIELVDKLSNIIAVISWFTIEETIKKEYRIYSLEKEDYLNDILQVVRDLHE